MTMNCNKQKVPLKCELSIDKFWFFPFSYNPGKEETKIQKPIFGSKSKIWASKNTLGLQYPRLSLTLCEITVKLEFLAKKKLEKFWLSVDSDFWYNI